MVRKRRIGSEYRHTCPLGWGLGVGVQPSHHKHSIVSKLREWGGLGSKMCPSTVEKKDMIGRESSPCVIWGVGGGVGSRICMEWVRPLKPATTSCPQICWRISTHSTAKLCEQSAAVRTPIRVREQKFPITQYFDLPPPSLYRHELRWTKSDAISGMNCRNCNRWVALQRNTRFQMRTLLPYTSWTLDFVYGYALSTVVTLHLMAPNDIKYSQELGRWF